MSRFQNTDKIEFKGKVTYGVWNQTIDFSTMTDEDITTYAVDGAHSGKAHLIAHEIYGDSSLEWVILAYNNALDTLSWPYAGTIIKVPSVQFVLPRIV